MLCAYVSGYLETVWRRMHVLCGFIIGESEFRLGFSLGFSLGLGLQFVSIEGVGVWFHWRLLSFRLRAKQMTMSLFIPTLCGRQRTDWNGMRL